MLNTLELHWISLSGAIAGFCGSAIFSLLIAYVYTSIPDYSVGLDLAAGLSFSMAIVILGDSMKRIKE